MVPLNNDIWYVQGTHKSLQANQKAKATVGAIIDGFGSLGNVYTTIIMY